MRYPGTDHGAVDLLDVASLSCETRRDSRGAQRPDDHGVPRRDAQDPPPEGIHRAISAGDLVIDSRPCSKRRGVGAEQLDKGVVDDGQSFGRRAVQAHDAPHPLAAGGRMPLVGNDRQT